MKRRPSAQAHHRSTTQPSFSSRLGIWKIVYSPKTNKTHDMDTRFWIPWSTCPTANDPPRFILISRRRIVTVPRSDAANCPKGMYQDILMSRTSRMFSRWSRPETNRMRGADAIAFVYLGCLLLMSCELVVGIICGW